MTIESISTSIDQSKMLKKELIQEEGKQLSTLKV